jgi:hypothetical protein
VSDPTVYKRNAIALQTECLPTFPDPLAEPAEARERSRASGPCRTCRRIDVLNGPVAIHQRLQNTLPPEGFMDELARVKANSVASRLRHLIADDRDSADQPS